MFLGVAWPLQSINPMRHKKPEEQVTCSPVIVRERLLVLRPLYDSPHRPLPYQAMSATTSTHKSAPVPLTSPIT